MFNRDSTRIERDSLGTVAVPRRAYFGAQTARALDNFQISGIPISKFRELIHGLGIVKKAAARANCRLGSLARDKAGWIEAACNDVIAGRLDSEFPIDVFQGGAGTSTNMNANEVIANRALELMGHPRGRYDIVHPNNDVNRSQSTNDVYPTAIRLSLLFSYIGLRDALDRLAAGFDAKADEFRSVLKLGRTQLQDAVPMTLGQEFSAFAASVRGDALCLEQTAGLLGEVNLGGTAIGTGINADPRYREIVIEELVAITSLPLLPAENLLSSSWDAGIFVLFSGALKRSATTLSKICNDLRLLSSGPKGGLNEIILPALQPGSSIMPGKINPVAPEVVNQVAFQVAGSDLTITLAAGAGQLQLNAMEPVIVFNLLGSLELLKNAVRVLSEKCVMGIAANSDICRFHLDSSTAVAAALTPFIGYERAARLAEQVLDSGCTIPDILRTEPEQEDLVALAANVTALADPHGNFLRD